MKILQINSICGIRSTGRICADIAEFLTAQGNECKIAYGRESVPEKYQKYVVRVGSGTGVKLHALKTRLFDDAGFGSKRATQKLIRWMKDENPDVIHLHNIHGYYLHIPLLFDYLKKSDKPVIWTLHDCWAFTGHCCYFDSVGCEKWKDGCFACPRKKAYPASLFLDKSKRNFARKREIFCGVKNLTIVTPSLWLANLVKQSFLKEYPIQVIHNGIDTEAFRPTEGTFRQDYQLEDKKVVLGVANIWSARKGLADFVQLSSMLPEDYQVVLAGLSDEQIKSLPPNIIGMGRTKTLTELAHLYTMADVFVNPTYNDNYPTVNLEAQACGTPVITYRTGGSVESVPPDCVVPQGDVAGLCEKIMAQTAERKEGLLLDKKEMANQYIALYHSKNI